MDDNLLHDVVAAARKAGADADARYVWARWKAMNRVLQEWDVTADVVADMAIPR